MSNRTAGRLRIIRDIRGMSLVEVMIAMVILLFVALALMQTVTVAIDANMKNALMDEATKLAAETLSQRRNVAIANIPTATVMVPRTVRNVAVRTGTAAGYQVLTNTTSAGGAGTRLTVTVNWSWKNQNYTTSVQTLRR